VEKPRAHQESEEGFPKTPGLQQVFPLRKWLPGREFAVSLRKTLDFLIFIPQIYSNFPPEGTCGFSPRAKSKIREDVIAMICTVVKKGVECAFMSNKGCQFVGGRCKTVVEQCEGCQKVA